MQINYFTARHFLRKATLKTSGYPETTSPPPLLKGEELLKSKMQVLCIKKLSYICKK